MAHSLSEVFVNGNPHLESLGVVVLEYGDGRACMALELRDEFMNSWHVTHGGISMTLLDVAMGLAARTAVPDAKSSATVDMSTSFLRPAGTSGDTIIAHGPGLSSFHYHVLLRCRIVEWRPAGGQGDGYLQGHQTGRYRQTPDF
jgi:uncharacterized protein (TIGR00369 family)